MKITEDVRKDAAKQELSEEQALQSGMEQKSREFSKAGAKIFRSELSSQNEASGAALTV